MLLQYIYSFQQSLAFVFIFKYYVKVIGCCILMDLKIRTKSSIIGSIIFKYILKLCVIGLMIHNSISNQVLFNRTDLLINLIL